MRLIVHRTESSLLLCYVDHHDKASQWAERRKLETHPKTGAAQFVVIRELVREIASPDKCLGYAAVLETDALSPGSSPASGRGEHFRTPKPLLFAGRSDDELLGYGMPPEWLPDARAAPEDTLLVLAEHLPAEAAEALLELATGGQSQPERLADTVAPFDHPDAQRRFRIMRDAEELERALAFPWEKWTVFLHPAQRTGGAQLPTDRHGWPVPPAPARPSWHCTVRYIWRARAPMPACC